MQKLFKKVNKSHKKEKWLINKPKTADCWVMSTSRKCMLIEVWGHTQCAQWWCGWSAPLISKWELEQRSTSWSGETCRLVWTILLVVSFWTWERQTKTRTEANHHDIRWIVWKNMTLFKFNLDVIVMPFKYCYNNKDHFCSDTGLLSVCIMFVIRKMQ